MSLACRLVLAGALLVLASGCASSGAPGADTPASPDAASLLEIEAQAAQAYRAQRSADAVRLYTSLLEAVPEEPEYWYRLANSLVRTGRYGEAELAYQHLLGLQPDHARAWHNLGIVRVRRAQEAFAGAVRHSDAGGAVFKGSLELSTALFSLVGRDAEGEESGTPETE